MNSATSPTSRAQPLEPPLAPLEFADVYEQTFPFVWRCARRLGVDPSAQDDVCQEVFVVVHRRLAEFRGESSLKTWIFGIVSNVVHTHRRTQQRKEPALRSLVPLLDPSELSASSGDDPHELAVRRESVRAAQDVFASLPEDKRVLLMLADLEDVPVPEIAELTGTNLNTVYARLRAARSALADAVRRYRARAGGSAHG
jgi:RNA polymerase sigma-70 factor, ECF subfamily